jgi:hypothetical protein
MNRREGENLPAATELIWCACIESAIRADIPGREDLFAAMRTDFTLQGVALSL